MIELVAFILMIIFVAVVLLLTMIGMAVWLVRTVTKRKRAKHARKKVLSSNEPLR